MSIASLIRSMADAGAPAEAIALAVEAIENAQGALDRQREAARDRKRRQRANGRDEDVTVTGQSRDTDETVTSHGSPPLSPPPQTPPPHTPPPVEGSIARKAARRCPDRWEPSPADLTVGETEGLSLGEITGELAKFRDHTFGTPRSDWSATFRNWLREAARRTKPKAQNARSHSTNTRAEARSVWSDIAADEAAARSGGDGSRLRLAG